MIATTVDPLPHVWWLASRASGVVALALVTLAVAIGLMQAGKLVKKRGLGPKLSALHEQLSLAGLVAIAVHGLTLLGDPFLHPGPSGIAIPFAMGYRPFFTGLGIIGGYLAALLGLTFYLRRRIGPKLWRKAHRFTVVAYLLALIHTLGAGSDAGTEWLRTAILASALPIGALFLARLRQQRRPAPRPAPRRRPVPPVIQEFQ